MLMIAAPVSIWKAADQVRKLLARGRSYIFGKEKSNAFGL